MLALMLTDASIAASAVNVSFYEGDGNFEITFTETAQWWSSAALTSQTQAGNDGNLTLTGILGGVASNYNWSLTLSDPNDNTEHLFFALATTVPPPPPPKAVINDDETSAIMVKFTTSGIDNNEHLFGLGTQFSIFELYNRTVRVWASEQGVGRGLQPLTTLIDEMDRGSGGNLNTTYTQIPALFSSLGRGIALDTYEYSEWTFQQIGDGFTIRVLAPCITGRVWGINGGNLIQAAAAFASISGTQPPLPSWVSNGAIIGLEGGTDAVLESLSRIKAFAPQPLDNNEDDNIAGVWLQDWTGGVNITEGLPRYGVFWNWQGLNTSTYPQWSERLLPALNHSRFLCYVNPHIDPSGPLFTLALAQNALVLHANGTIYYTYGGKALVDLFNQHAATWFQSILIEAFTSSNCSGFMADFGEAYPLTAHDGFSKHGAFPAVWASIVSEAAAVAASTTQSNHHFFWMRSASIISPSFVPLFWLGDQLVSWDYFDGLASLPRALLSASLSGMGVTHFDIGAYTTLAILAYTRSKELFMRSTEFAAFTWCMRTHPGSDPSTNWQLDSDAETVQHFFSMVQIFKSLSSYRLQVFAQLTITGTPVYLPTAALFPNAPWTLDSQLFLGSQLLYAPVLYPNVTQVTLWLPKGLWRHVITNLTFIGEDDFITIDAPIGRPAALWYQARPDLGKS